MSFSPCTKRSHAPYTAASFALWDTDSSRWTLVIRDRLRSARRDGRHLRCPSAGTPLILHRPLATFVKIFTYLSGLPGRVCFRQGVQWTVSPFAVGFSLP